MDTRRLRPGPAAAALALWLGSAAAAQHEPPATPAADRNAAATAPTHAAHPKLHPLVAWQFVQAGNAEHVQARAAAAARRPGAAGSHHARSTATKHAPARKRPVRPAGAGRYVCAVLACADQDVDLAETLGLRRRDVLVLRAPGPFVTPEAVALLERAVTRHRLSLVVVLGHDTCDSLQPSGGAPDALDRRLTALRRLAERRRQPLHEAIVRRQRELLLTSSATLQRAAKEDELRVLPGMLDDESRAVRWIAKRAHTLPLAPVK